MKKTVCILIIVCVALLAMNVVQWTAKVRDWSEYDNLHQENADLKIQVRVLKGTMEHLSDVVMGRIPKKLSHPEIAQRMKVLRAEIVRQGH